MSERSILEGIRVVEVGDVTAASVATMLLGAAGADVIKVEPPEGAANRGSPGFATSNRSKRSVVLDLASVSGRDQLEVLVAGADALVHGLTPSALPGWTSPTTRCAGASRRWWFAP